MQTENSSKNQSTLGLAHQPTQTRRQNKHTTVNTQQWTYESNTAFVGSTVTGSDGLITHDTTPTSDATKQRSNCTLPMLTVTGPNTDVSSTISVTFTPGSMLNTASAFVFPQPATMTEGELDSDTDGLGDRVTLLDAVSVSVTEVVDDTVDELVSVAVADADVDSAAVNDFEYEWDAV